MATLLPKQTHCSDDRYVLTDSSSAASLDLLCSLCINIVVTSGCVITEVPVRAPNKYWKIFIPSLEFGAMHAILFQMALIPLTMCRFSLAQLSTTILKNYLPFNRITAMHIHLGYTMFTIVFVATCVFFIFFGHMCELQKMGLEPTPKGEFTFCDKLSTEIMNTGLGILGTLIIIVGTSYFRDKIPYEVFYAIHHLMIALFAITVAHTMDNEERSGALKRSQTFKWFSAPLLYYFLDRLFMAMTQAFKTPIVEAIAVERSGLASKMVILRVRKPIAFNFRPGNYVFLKAKKLDATWHPYSIGSEPMCDTLDFFMEVYSENSWTDKLWRAIYARQHDPNAPNDSSDLEIEVIGPYGSGLGDAKNFTHMFAFGSGTGIVPMISHLKAHVHYLCSLQPQVFFQNKEMRRVRRHQIEKELQSSGTVIGRTCSSIYNLFDGNFKKTKEQQLHLDYTNPVYAEKYRTAAIRIQHLYMHRSITKYGNDSAVIKTFGKRRTKLGFRTVFSILKATLPVYYLIILSLMLSWSNLDGGADPAMKLTLLILSVIAVALFAIFAVNGRVNNLATYIDMTMVVLAVLLGWFFDDSVQELAPWQQFICTLVTGYMCYRTWTTAAYVKGSELASFETADNNQLDKFKFVWVTRSAALTAELWPELDKAYSQLQKSWGANATSRVLQMDVFCTDSDPVACERLAEVVCNTKLYVNKSLQFRRPDIDKLIQGHIVELSRSDILDGYDVQTATLIAFCGSPPLGRVVGTAAAEVTLDAALTGNKHHKIHFEQENYGLRAAPKAIVKGERKISYDGVNALEMGNMFEKNPTEAALPSERRGIKSFNVE